MCLRSRPVPPRLVANPSGEPDLPGITNPNQSLDFVSHSGEYGWFPPRTLELGAAPGSGLISGDATLAEGPANLAKRTIAVVEVGRGSMWQPIVSR